MLWTLRTGHKELACSSILTASEIHMAINGRTPSHRRTCQTQDELLAWTADERTRCLAEGWS